MTSIINADLARTQLAQTVKDARSIILTNARQTGPAYASIVRAVAVCQDASVALKVIAATISNAWTGGKARPGDVSKGSASRYVVLARYQRKEFTTGERTPRGSVPVDGTDYPSPCDALDSGETFSAVYLSWTKAVKRASKPERITAFEAAHDAIERLSIGTVDRSGTLTRLKVMDSVEACAGMLASLVSLPTAVQFIPPRTRHSIMEAVKRATRRKRAA